MPSAKPMPIDGGRSSRSWGSSHAARIALALGSSLLIPLRAEGRHRLVEGGRYPRRLVRGSILSATVLGWVPTHADVKTIVLVHRAFATANRDDKAIAIEAAEYLKYKHPHGRGIV